MFSVNVTKNQKHVIFQSFYSKEEYLSLATSPLCIAQSQQVHMFIRSQKTYLQNVATDFSNFSKITSAAILDKVLDKSETLWQMFINIID